jgi:hypothetical protein
MAMDRLQHQGLQDGIMEIAYGWSDDDMAGPRGALRKFVSILRLGLRTLTVLQRRELRPRRPRFWRRRPAGSTDARWARTSRARWARR